VRALRGGRPESANPGDIDEALARYECGAYLHAFASRPGGELLPEPWRSACGRIHRRTVVESLAALGQWKEAAEAFQRAGLRSILLKGMAYLATLYPEPGWRPLIDVDLLVRQEDVPAVVRRLERLGYTLAPTPYDREFQRLTMERAGVPGSCGLEIHWSLGAPHRPAIPGGRLLEMARPVRLEGLEALVLPDEASIVYHAGHAADHYFGPSLKWALDLREMVRRYRVDWQRVTGLAEQWRCRSALAWAWAQQERLFPDEAPRAGRRPSGPALRAATTPGPAEFLWDGIEPRRPWLLRWLLADSTSDVWRMAASAAARPLRRVTGRAAWADGVD